MKVTLLGFTVPPDLLAYINARDRLMQTQTHRFAWGLVGAFRTNGAEVRLISAAPVSDFPQNSRMFWTKCRFEVDGVAGLQLPFVNLVVLKHITRYLSCWVFGLRELRRRRPDWLVVHGVHSPFLWFSVTAGRRLGIRVAVVLTDPPGVIRTEDGALVRLLKKVDIGVISKALARADGVVVLTEPLARDFAGGVPYLVVEGMFDASEWSMVSGGRDAATARTIVYAGGLHKEYGVQNLVRAFRALDDANASLEIFGKGPLEPWLQQQAVEDQRISPPRLVTPHELAAEYAQAAILVQPRQIDQDFVPYSFPSKLIEYMASGAVVVSTRLSSIPPEYEPFLVWTGDTSVELAQTINRVLAQPAEERRALGDQASSFVRRNRDTISQGFKIIAFMDSIAQRAGGN